MVSSAATMTGPSNLRWIRAVRSMRSTSTLVRHLLTGFGREMAGCPPRSKGKESLPHGGNPEVGQGPRADAEEGSDRRPDRAGDGDGGGACFAGAAAVKFHGWLG